MSLFLIIISPLAAALLSIFVKKNRLFIESFTMVSSIIEILAGIMIIGEVVKNGHYSSGPYFSVDAFGAILIMILITVASAASVYSVKFLREEVAREFIGFRRLKQHYVLFNLFIAAILLAVSTTNPIIMWVAIEATTLSTAFLISFYNKPKATEAAWKYLIVNSIGLLLSFFGTLLFLAPSIKTAGILGPISWDDIMRNANNFDPYLIKVAFIFIFIGYGTKMGLVPMHTWLPDAHSKAPAPTSSLLSGALLNIAFFAILRYKVVIDASIGQQFSQNLLMFFGVLSTLVAAFIIFIQKSYKRLLAYSSIEHMGIMALGFGFGGLGAFAAVLQMIYHSLVKTALFLLSGNAFLKYGSSKIKNVRGMISALPVTSVLFFIGVLIITGVPPFGIFLTEFHILSAGIAEHPYVVSAALFSFVLVFVGFLKHLIVMEFSEETVERGEAGLLTILPPAVLLALLIFIGFYIPEPIMILIKSVALKY